MKKLLLACLAVILIAASASASPFNGASVFNYNAYPSLPSGTFANKPAGAAGSLYYATDIGTNGSLLISNGTFYKPASGCAVLSENPAAQTGAGTGAEANYAVVTIPAGLLSANGWLEIYAQGAWTGTTATKTFLIRHNTTSGAVTSGSVLINTTDGGSSSSLSGNIFKVLMNNGATNAQVFLPSGTATFGGVSSSTGLQAGAIQTSSASYLNFNMTGNASDTVGYQGIVVKWCER